MLVDVIRHQHEKIGNAIHALMSLTLPPAERRARAVGELGLAFAAGRAAEWAAPYVTAIRTIADRLDRGGADAAAEAADLDALVAAFFELYTIACREYWTA